MSKIVLSMESLEIINLINKFNKIYYKKIRFHILEEDFDVKEIKRLFSKKVIDYNNDNSIKILSNFGFKEKILKFYKLIKLKEYLNKFKHSIESYNKFSDKYTTVFSFFNFFDSLTVEFEDNEIRFYLNSIVNVEYYVDDIIEDCSIFLVNFLLDDNFDIENIYGMSERVNYEDDFEF